MSHRPWRLGRPREGHSSSRWRIPQPAACLPGPAYTAAQLHPAAVCLSNEQPNLHRPDYGRQRILHRCGGAEDSGLDSWRLPRHAVLHGAPGGPSWERPRNSRRVRTRRILTFILSLTRGTGPAYISDLAGYCPADAYPDCEPQPTFSANGELLPCLVK